MIGILESKLVFRDNLLIRKRKSWIAGFGKKEVSIKELKMLLSQRQNEIQLIDVRNQNEYNECSISGSILIPLSTIESGEAINKIKILGANKNLYVFCKSGKRSLSALRHLKKCGIKGINIEGGIDAWNKESIG